MLERLAGFRAKVQAELEALGDIDDELHAAVTGASRSALWQDGALIHFAKPMHAMRVTPVKSSRAALQIHTVTSTRACRCAV